MHHGLSNEDVGKIWDSNADLWSDLVRKGHDLYRDYVNTPGFFSILPHVNDLYGLDIGCGEGFNTRLLAQRGAKMIGVDISPNFIKHAKAEEEKEPQGINYLEANACKLPFEDSSFDFLASFAVLMDIPDYNTALSEAYRVLKPGGFLQFSITHPCFWTPDLQWCHDRSGKKQALACRDYFKGSEGVINEWIFDGVSQDFSRKKKFFKTPLFKRTLSEWVNSLTKVGFTIECFHEPRAVSGTFEKFPFLDGCDIIPFFLIIRCRKNTNCLTSKKFHQ